jgi:N-acyl-D-aspartate/D-glutamate deacylase
MGNPEKGCSMIASDPSAPRRGWVKAAAACAAALLGLAVLAWFYWQPSDFLIADVCYLRGDRITEQPANIGITGDRITYVGTNRIRASNVIDGAGLVLTPGLIDVNSCGWLSDSAAMLKLRDGVTTFLNAHGDSFKADARKFRVSEKLNYATSVGLIPVEVNHLSGPEMMAALGDSLRYGAYTLSLSPEYNAGTTPALITELSKRFAHRNVLFTFHLRYSSRAEELLGLKEALACAAAGNPVHILHITSTGATYHPEEALKLITDARAQGMQVTYDFYPYTSWTSSIHRARFAGDWQARYGVDFSRVRIFGEDALTQVRFDELQRQAQDCNVIVDSIPQATVDYFATNTDCPIGTDSPANPDTTHPRGAGSFAKFVNDYVDTGKISFGQAMYRFSTATAEKFSPYIPGLHKRGAIKVGYAADLVLWDRAKIKSRADFAHPLEPSSGVVAAFVNGVPEILNGQVTNVNLSPGRHLKGAWAARR